MGIIKLVSLRSEVVHSYFMKIVGKFPHNEEVTNLHRCSLPAALLAHRHCLLI